MPREKIYKTKEAKHKAKIGYVNKTQKKIYSMFSYRFHKDYDKDVIDVLKNSQNQRVLLKSLIRGFIYTPQTKRALSIMFEAHKDQLDKSGLPYVFYPFLLAYEMPDEKTTIVALLHDVQEDTDVTITGFDQEIIDALNILTKKDDDDYFAYISRIKTNPIARTVKLADLKHNMNLTRLDEVTTEDIERVAKYQKAYEMLVEVSAKK